MDQIVLRHVTKRFTTKKLGTITAVNDFNLAVKEGECFSFLGPSGCGKTTTLRMIAGFEDGDVATADYYWEYDRYYSYSYLLGFGDSSMNNADGTAYNEAAVTAMEAYIAAHPDSTIAANMQKIVDSIKAEGFYGDVTYEVANEILNAEFEAFFAYLDTQYADEEAAATAAEGATGEAVVEPVLTDTTITE